MYSRLDRIPACDKQTDGQPDGQPDGPTSCHGIVRAMHTRRAVKVLMYKLISNIRLREQDLRLYVKVLFACRRQCRT